MPQAKRGTLAEVVVRTFGPGTAPHIRVATAAAMALISATTLAEGSAVPAPAAYEDFMILTVDKQSLKAELRTWPEEPEKSVALRSFRIAIGKEDGDKVQEGDNRTPEGIYFAQNHIDDKALPEKYGAKAIPIDFPNPIDQLTGKTGHGIWLHGVDREQRIEEAKVTEGCVAFYNQDIERLSDWLVGHQGLVVIARDLRQVNQENDIKSVRARTMDWLKSWASRQVDSYLGNYAMDFRYGAMNLAAYRDYKRRVFGSYREMKVDFDGLRIVSHPKYAVSFFNQDFRGDNRFTSIGRKILYWEKDAAGEWRIKREVFENRRFEVLRYTDAEVTTLGTHSAAVDDKREPPSL